MGDQVRPEYAIIPICAEFTDGLMINSGFSGPLSQSAINFFSEDSSIKRNEDVLNEPYEHFRCFFEDAEPNTVLEEYYQVLESIRLTFHEILFKKNIPPNLIRNFLEKGCF